MTDSPKHPLAGKAQGLSYSEMQRSRWIAFVRPGFLVAKMTEVGLWYQFWMVDVHIALLRDALAIEAHAGQGVTA